jgi:hypothetical protein
VWGEAERDIMSCVSTENVIAPLNDKCFNIFWLDRVKTLDRKINTQERSKILAFELGIPDTITKETIVCRVSTKSPSNPFNILVIY